MDPDWLQPKHPKWLETTDTEGVPYYFEVAPTGKTTYSKPMFVQGLEPPPPPPSASSATSSATSSSASSSSGSSASYQLPIVGSKRKGGRQSGKGKKKKTKHSCPSCDYVTSNAGYFTNHKKGHSGQFQSCNYCSFRSDIKSCFDHFGVFGARNYHRCKEGDAARAVVDQIYDLFYR